MNILKLCTLLFLFSCGLNYLSKVIDAPDVDYIGQSYPKTVKIDIYLNESDIEKRFIIMGKAVCESSNSSVMAQDLQKSVEDMAQEKGAHAIILGDYNQVEYNPRTITEIKIDTLKNGNVRKQTIEKGVRYSDKKYLEAVFIRYKDQN